MQSTARTTRTPPTNNRAPPSPRQATTFPDNHHCISAGYNFSGGLAVPFCP